MRSLVILWRKYNEQGAAEIFRQRCRLIMFIDKPGRNGALTAVYYYAGADDCTGSKAPG